MNSLHCSDCGIIQHVDMGTLSYSLIIAQFWPKKRNNFLFTQKQNLPVYLTASILVYFTRFYLYKTRKRSSHLKMLMEHNIEYRYRIMYRTCDYRLFRYLSGTLISRSFSNYFSCCVYLILFLFFLELFLFLFVAGTGVWHILGAGPHPILHQYLPQLGTGPSSQVQFPKTYLSTCHKQMWYFQIITYCLTWLGHSNFSLHAWLFWLSLQNKKRLF